MFGTSIHWTTFFYLLVDTFLVLFTYLKSTKLRNNNLNRYLLLGVLFVLYNLTGGFLPFDNFPGPFILQYIISYGVAIAMCLYVVYYMYKEYDISLLKSYLTITNIALYVTGCFLILFLFPYFLTKSLYLARILFTVPVSLICLHILWAFYRKISDPPNPNRFILRRIRLSLISLTCIALLPLLTVLGDYQWLTFTIVNTSFYMITAMEIDRYLYFLVHKNKLSEIFAFYKNNKKKILEANLLFKRLTGREIEIVPSILDNLTYKQIGEDFFIAESTVSKHASNIFKKTGVKNRQQFISRFRKK